MTALFLSLFEKDMKDALKGDLSGNLERIMVALVTPPAVFDAKQLKKSMKVSLRRQRCAFCYLLIWEILLAIFFLRPLLF